MHDLYRPSVFDHRDAWATRGLRSIQVTDSDHPYMKHWWGPGGRSATNTASSTRWRILADFVGGESGVLSIRKVLATDYVTDAALRSVRDRQWAAVADSRLE
ncbi:MAG: hypothetical protein KGO02_11100 [Alphaproteobacteria bacterium]|nr:hypothetical protein [Alphaproteobacteria bacterium]